MKLLSLFFSLSIVSSFCTYASEGVAAASKAGAASAAESKTTSKLFIENTTSWKLMVKYSYDGSTMLGACIVPNTAIIIELTGPLNSLQVYPSGAVWGKTQIQSPQELTKSPDFQNTIDHGETLLLRIRSFRSLLAFAAPFVFRFAIIETKERSLADKPILTSIDKAFPDVVDTLSKNRLPLARHFLSLSDDKSELTYPEAFNEAYRRLNSCWSSALNESNPLRVTILELLKKAYDLAVLQKTLTPLSDGYQAAKLCVSLEDVFSGTLDKSTVDKIYQEQLYNITHMLPRTDELDAIKKCIDCEYELIAAALEFKDAR